MPEASTSPDASEFPARYWWLKRIAVAMVLLAGVLVGLRYLALHVAQRRLEAEIAAIKARGEPLTEGFEDLPAAAEEDAGPDLLAAGKLYAVPRPHQLVWNQIPHFTYAPQNAATIDAVLSANRAALAKVRAARGKRVVNWGVGIRSHADAVRLPMLREMRQLGDALRLAALKAVSDGNHDEAVEYLRDWLMLSRSLESQPMLISHLTATGMQAGTARTISMSAANLRIGAGAGAAGEEQVKALIQELLDERETARSGRRWAWQGERMIQMEFILRMAHEEWENGAHEEHMYIRFVEWWMRPMKVANAHDLLGRASAYVKAAGAPDLSQATDIIREWENQHARNRELKILGAAGYGNLNSQYQAVYWRREAAMALAARLFQAKHRRHPNDVSELVPEFLPQVPLDPLRGYGQTMVLRPDAKR